MSLRHAKRGEVATNTKKHQRNNSKLKSAFKIFAVMFTVITVFLAGIGVGNGTIQFGSDAIFKKSVNKNLPKDLDYASVEEVYDTLKQSFDGELDQTKLLDGLKQGLAKASGDPYTEYYNKKDAEEFTDELNGSFTGIGAELTKRDDAIVIIAPLAGFPAEKAGLKPKDVIVEIDGKSAIGITVGEAVQKIRGPKDTNVKITVIRAGKEKLNFDIKRDQINVPSVKYEIKDRIGIITISRFAEDTAKLTKEAADKFKQQNAKGVILDLRGNPGGFLDGAVDISSLWLKPGSLVLLEKRNGVVVKSFDASGEPVLLGIPTVVLIDDGSASASEITAGALKDNNAATLIGTKSFGKGSVQALEHLKDGGFLKVTIAKWFTPNGVNINQEGIKPDQNVEISEQDYLKDKDPQKEAAIIFLNKN